MKILIVAGAWLLFANGERPPIPFPTYEACEQAKKEATEFLKDVMSRQNLVVCIHGGNDVKVSGNTK